MFVLLMIPVVLVLVVSIPISILMELNGGWQHLSGNSKAELFMKLCCLASGALPSLALFGVEWSYEFVKEYMSVYLIFLLIYGFVSYSNNPCFSKGLFWLTAVPCAISAFSLLLERLDVYAPIGRPYWCMIDICFLVGKAMMMAGVGYRGDK